MQRLASLLCVTGLACLAGCALPQRKVSRNFFPIGICSVNSTSDYETVKSAGFNLVGGSADDACLDAARAAGLRVLAAPNTSAGPEFNPTAARKAVKDYDGHPALWAWSLVDEPDLNAVPPQQVIQAHRCLKDARARKPTALTLYQGYEALHYANLADITMIDRYPIPWLPLANFGQHVTLARLAVAKDKLLLAVIQAFDWSSYPEMLPGEKNLRPPTYEELRCMTYEALARGANGLFYFAFDSGRWKILDHPETWEALKAVVKEVNARLPLFEAKPQWWAKNHKFSDPTHRFNAALESSVTSTLLRVGVGNDLVPPGDYILAVNNTERPHGYSFTLPQRSEVGEYWSEHRGQKAQREAPGALLLPLAAARSQTLVPVLGERRSIAPEAGWLTDAFPPYAVHLYGPF